MKTSKKWRKPLFRQPERRQGILPALFGARIGALLPSSSQWPLCATAKTASFHSPAQAKRRKITWMPLELLPPPKGRKKPGPTLYGGICQAKVDTEK